jgi:hypothetical protein
MTAFHGTLSQAQLEQLWDQQGGNPAEAPTASAIAEAESSGDEQATNTSSAGTARGYWQIESSHGALSTYNPEGNAKAAIAISDNGTNWSPWETFTSGAYKKFLGGKHATPVPANPSTTPTPPTTTPTTASSSNPFLPSGRGTGDALKYLTYIAIMLAGAGLLYTAANKAKAHQ